MKGAAMKKFLVLLILLLMACKTVSLEILPGSPTPWLVETHAPTVASLIKTPAAQTTPPKGATPTQTFPTPMNCRIPSGWKPITIQPGDTLLSLAATYGTTATELRAGNCLATQTLLPGTLLYVPPLPPVVQNTTPKPAASATPAKPQPTSAPVASAPPPAPPTPTPTAQEQAVKELADQAIQALKKGDMQTLAGLIDPARGVRFSPYAFVHEEDRRYLPNPLKRAFTDNGGEEHRQKYLWGHFDGSGLPIEMTFKQYYERFVYDQDFANAELVGVNQSFSQGNTIDNLADFYPGAMFVEYYFPGFDEKYQGMDWEALRLVFQQTVVQNTTPKDQWRLVGIIHDQWTI
jgi:hypothetical protein